jgi:2-methylcitrate dehydratase PrpD
VRTTASGLTGRLIELVTDTGQHPSAEVTDLVERAVVDTVAVSLAARDDEGVRAGFEALAEPVRDGCSTVLLTGERTSAAQAALLGGLAAHALDYDDVDDILLGHPSAVLVPALLACAEEIDASGPDLVDAFWVGLRAGRIVSTVVGIGPHYSAGWHSTSSLGSIAAAAAVARLRALSERETANALGIAGSLAAGSRQNFGTMTKPLHAGWAAEIGIRATRLASTGFTADSHQLEGPLGFLALHGGSSLDPAQHDSILDAAHGLELPAVNLKLYPCCYYTHSGAEAALRLAQDGLRAQDCERLVVSVQKGGLAPLIHHRPRTGLEAKFSMEYVVAVALLDGEIVLRSFSDEQVARQEPQALLRRVEVHEVPTPPVGGPAEDAFTVIEAHTSAGVVSSRVDRALGHATRPVPDSRLRDKWADCLSTWSGSDVDGAFELLRGIGRAPSLREVAARLTELLGSRTAVTNDQRGIA